MSQSLRVSTSGIRGKVGSDITPDFVRQVIANLCRVYGPGSSIAIARDARPSGEELYVIVREVMSQYGIHVHDCGFVPVPTLSMYVRDHQDLVAGVHITASHNPPEYNGIKIFAADGTYVTPEVLRSYVDSIVQKPSAETIPGHVYDTGQQALDNHIQVVRHLTQEGRSLAIAVDALNSVGANTLPTYLESIGCQVLHIATTIGEPFPHMPEPRPENLVWTQEQLVDKEYDFCAVVDPDADRLVLIDENGQLLPEEYTVPLVAKLMQMNGVQGKVVVNYSTSMIIEDVLAGSDLEVERCAVGEPHVVRRMQEIDAVFGGEGNGGVMDPRVTYGRDSLTGVMHIVNLLRITGKSLSEIVAELPTYYRHQDKVPIEGVDFSEIKQKLIAHFDGRGSINTEDGVYVRFTDAKSWLHVRPSNTEPILRIFLEHKTEEGLQKLITEVKSVIG